MKIGEECWFFELELEEVAVCVAEAGGGTKTLIPGRGLETRPRGSIEGRGAIGGVDVGDGGQRKVEDC